MARIEHILLAALVVSTASSTSRGATPPEARPKQVLIVHTFGLHFQPFVNLTTAFRTELAARFPGPVEFHDISLETARFEEGTMDEPVTEYVRALAARSPPDLVVAAGAPAFKFCQRHAGDVFKNTAILGAGIEQRHTDGIDYGPATALVSDNVDLVGIVDGILTLLPATRRIYVIMGSAPLERFWAERARREWLVFGDRVEFVWLDNLTLPAIVGRTASLPPASVILFALMQVDAAGVPYERYSSLEAVRESASAPIFGMFAPDVGHGPVGGRLIDVHELGVQSAIIAERILSGESPAGIERVTVAPSAPVYDARELKRWNIPESRLPAGSVLRFEEPSLWKVYRTQIIVATVLFFLQTLVISLYLANRLRLRAVRNDLRVRENAVRELRRELNHVGRVSLLGQFTASLAHELGQPLGAILRNAEAAELFLEERPANLEEVGAIVRDVRTDATRAGDVIARLRRMLVHGGVEMQTLAWPEVMRDVTHVVKSEASARGIALEIDVPSGLPAGLADRVHIEQVLLNLVANAMDATDGVAGGRVVVRVRSDGNGFVECAVSDNGTGIEPDRLDIIFEPFVTSKACGMGMGLPISRSIVEACGGRLWAESSAGRGATFRFTLPVAEEVQLHA